MKVIISGASGLLGTALTNALRAEKHTVFHLVRPGRALAGDEIGWNPPSARVDVARLEDADAVVNLSGASISEGRWTFARKQLLRSSRVDSTRVLVNSLAQLRQKPRVFLSASAVGYYGNRGDEILTESSHSGSDFLASLTRDWEAEAMRASQAGIRTLILRLGVVLAANGGALPPMVRPFRLGVGGGIGSGRQWLSWIALEDAVGVFGFGIANPQLQGPINVAAPQPVRNAEFARLVGRILHRPAIFRAPALVLRLVFGEMADALLLTSARVLPKQLLAMNYPFRLPDLDTALQAILLAK